MKTQDFTIHCKFVWNGIICVICVKNKELLSFWGRNSSKNNLIAFIEILETTCTPLKFFAKLKTIVLACLCPVLDENVGYLSGKLLH